MIVNAKDLIEAVVEVMRKEAERRPFANKVRPSTDPGERWDAIVHFYRCALPDIMERPAHVWGIDPYEIDWTVTMTPIEFGLWQDIRSAGAVLYPQFPIGRYFVDYANPKAMVAIECDGAEFHRDAERDRRRQREIERHGWTVYRFTGRECLEPDEVWDEERGDYIPNKTPSRETFRNIVLAHRLADWAIDDE
jgi:very-short-patch-repair endonuclease